MRKLLAMLVAVMLLCTVLPMAALAADDECPRCHKSNWGGWNNYTFATCEENAKEARTCLTPFCLYTQTQENPNTALGHRVTNWTYKDATCTEGGTKTGKCTRLGCGKTVTESTGGALGHKYVLKTQVLATCTADGYEDYVCENNNAHTDHKILTKLGHAYSDVVTLPTCTEQGYTTHTCSRCSDTYVDNYENALDHDYVEVSNTATCTEDGMKTFDCSRCDAGYTEDSNALGHDYVAVVTDPTCTEDGYTTHTCSRCKDTYTDTVVTAPGHDYVDVVTDPTCSQKGYTTHTCSVCGDSYEDAYVEMIPHTESNEWVVTKVATCTAEGEEARLCPVCKTALETKVIQKTPHNYSEDWTYGDTFHWHACTDCGAKDNEIKHDFEFTNKRDPNCVEDGLYKAECKICHFVIEDYHYGNALGHDFVADEADKANAKAATCTENGYEPAAKCSRCEETKQGHVIEALGHSIEKVQGKYPTCTEVGWEDYDKCNRSGCSFTEYKEIPALGHQYGEWHDAKDGEHHFRVCERNSKARSVCGAQQWEDHHWVKGRHGQKYCDVCGAKKPFFHRHDHHHYNDGSNPKTADDSNIELWVTVMSLSVVALAGVGVYGFKKRKHN